MKCGSKERELCLTPMFSSSSAVLPAWLKGLVVGLGECLAPETLRRGKMKLLSVEPRACNCFSSPLGTLGTLDLSISKWTSRHPSSGRCSCLSGCHCYLFFFKKSSSSLAHSVLSSLVKDAFIHLFCDV